LVFHNELYDFLKKLSIKINFLLNLYIRNEIVIFHFQTITKSKSMKKHYFMQIIAALIVPFLIYGCNRAGKQSKDVASGEEKAAEQIEVLDAEKVKAQLIKIIRESPKPVEIASLLNEAGASYISDLTVQPEDFEKMMTSTQKAFGIGLYAFDGKYASVFNRADEFLKVRDNANRLLTDLGLEEELKSAEKFEERLEKNKSNTDSLNYLVNKIYDNFHQHMQEDANADIYAISFIGANIEAIYILSQMTLLAENSEKLLAIMNNQDGLVESVASLMALMAENENVKPYNEKIQPVIQYFRRNETLTETGLDEINPLIQEARNSMIQL